jgi:hypothetical protein
MVTKSIEKGYLAEEALRSYFLSIGYFVVRGIPLSYRGINITDIDLWLYVKATSLTAERSCVDIKNKRTPQAMERVLWTKGLKEVLHVDRAIVVTTDNRQEIRDFGLEQGIGILQGDFLRRVITSFPQKNRLAEEDFISVLKTPCMIDRNIIWERWFQQIKGKLISNLDFDGCNSFLNAIKLLIEEYIVTNKTSEVPIRLLYVCLAYFLICLDYISRSFYQLEFPARISWLTNGFRYGEAGQQRTEEILKMALQLLTEAGKTDLFTNETLKNEIKNQMSEYHAEILGEHFARPESIKTLFSIANNFEEQAYAKTLLYPHELPSEQKAIIGLICDLFEYDRKKII